MDKEPIYRNRKPDLETESIRAWVSTKDEAKEAEKISQEEKHKIIIKCKNNFKMQLMGFTKFIDKRTDNIVFAYKFKKENKTIIYYAPKDLKKEQEEKIKLFLKKLQNMARLSGFEMIDGYEFAKRSADEAKRLRKLQ
jgi:hypothetical protein